MDHNISPLTSHSRKSPSVGIDDYLIDYRHHQNSIQEFLSCLDRSDMAEEGMMSGSSSFSSLPSHSTSHSTSSEASEIDIDSESSSLESKAAIHPRYDTATCTLVSKAYQPKKTIKNKQDMTEKEKDERRRFQNREAQRRFRERQMREEYRRASINQHGKLLAWLQTKTMSMN